MVWILAFYFCLCIFQTKQAPICRPTITEGQLGKPEIGGYISFECEISACEGLTKIVFEKEGHSSTWIQVFEGVNKTHYTALDTSSEYSVEDRYVYYAFRNKHSLHINPLILNDHGKWRCVAYTAKQEKYEASSLDFDIYVLPAEGIVAIRQNNSDLVIGQPGQFTCIADGVYPEPDGRWEVNGVGHGGNTTTTHREDQLWDLMSTIEIQFDSVGVYNLNFIMSTEARDTWLINSINITVQEPALVSYPQHNKTVTIDPYSTFSLDCGGSGFNPYITWEHDGESLLTNNTRYIIKSKCSTSKCEGSITSKPMDPTVACVDAKQYAGVYTCVIQLAYPFASSATSATLKVLFLEKLCKEGRVQAILIPILSVVCVAFVTCGIGFLVYRQKKGSSAKEEPAEETKELIDTNLVPLDFIAKIKPTYPVKVWLHLCAQFRVYDNVVLFDYGSNSVFIHDLSDLSQHIVYTCGIMIHDMIRISDDKFVVTEHKTHDIYLLQLRNKAFHTHNSMIRDKNNTRILICLDNDYNFIKCEFNGDDSLHFGIIYRVSVTDDKLKQKLLTPESFTVEGEPYFISLKNKNTKLVIVTHSGIIYTVDLQNYCVTSDDILLKYIDGDVMSLYIDTNDNIIIGDRGGQIHVYTLDKKHSVKEIVHEPVGGIAVIDRRMIVCYGKLGQQQHIEVLDTIKGERHRPLEEELYHIVPTYSTHHFLEFCAQRPGYDNVVLFDYQSKRVFIHDISDFNRHQEYNCDVNIYAMMRIADDKFVVTEFDIHKINLVQLEDNTFYTRYTIPQDRNSRRTLICAENDNSFLKCEFIGDDALLEGTIYRVNITNNTLRQQQLTPNPFIVKGEPWVMSLNSDSSKLVIVTDSGIIYTGDLDSYSPIPDEDMVYHIAGGVHSLYIDLNDNVFIGDRSGKIHMYTPEKEEFVVKELQDDACGISMIDEDRMIVCYGKRHEQQHINIFSLKQTHTQCGRCVQGYKHTP